MDHSLRHPVRMPGRNEFLYLGRATAGPRTGRAFADVPQAQVRLPRLGGAHTLH
jgi:hypothetical protein